MTVRTAGKMFKAVLRFFANALWHCDGIMAKQSLPLLEITETALEMTASRSRARAIFLFSRNVDCFDLDVKLEGVFVGNYSAPA